MRHLEHTKYRRREAQLALRPRSSKVNASARSRADVAPLGSARAHMSSASGPLLPPCEHLRKRRVGLADPLPQPLDAQPRASPPSRQPVAKSLVYHIREWRISTCPIFSQNMDWCCRRYFSTYEILTAVQWPRYRTCLPRVQKSTQPRTYMTALPRSSIKFSPDHSY
eukprot:SAG11_NODE_11665_length_745_cov_2.201238_1_plen_167_part_00